MSRLVLTSLNISSLQKHWGSFGPYGAGVWALQETRADSLTLLTLRAWAEKSSLTLVHSEPWETLGLPSHHDILSSVILRGSNPCDSGIIPPASRSLQSSRRKPTLAWQAQGKLP